MEEWARMIFVDHMSSLLVSPSSYIQNHNSWYVGQGHAKMSAVEERDKIWGITVCNEYHYM